MVDVVMIEERDGGVTSRKVVDLWWRWSWWWL